VTHILTVNCTEIYEDGPKQHAYKIDFNRLTFDLLRWSSLSCGGVKFRYAFKSHYYSIAHCTLITHLAAALVLSRVTWALLTLLVFISILFTDIDGQGLDLCSALLSPPQESCT